MKPALKSLSKALLCVGLGLTASAALTTASYADMTCSAGVCTGTDGSTNSGNLSSLTFDYSTAAGSSPITETFVASNVDFHNNIPQGNYGTVKIYSGVNNGSVMDAGLALVVINLDNNLAIDSNAGVGFFWPGTASAPTNPTSWVYNDLVPPTGKTVTWSNIAANSNNFDGFGRPTFQINCSSSIPGHPCTSYSNSDSVAFIINLNGGNIGDFGVFDVSARGPSPGFDACTGFLTTNTTANDTTQTGQNSTCGVAVPGPIAGAGLPGLVAACVGLFALARRRRQQVVA
jgi:hypothetical protein